MTDSLPEPSLAEMDFVALLAALADPIRLKTVHVLAERGETSCAQAGVFAGLEIGKSTLSHHLKVLREAGVVRSRISGKSKLISLRREDLDKRFPGLLSAVLAGAQTHAEVPAGSDQSDQVSPASRDAQRPVPPHSRFLV